jgi:hypothetical protein
VFTVRAAGLLLLASGMAWALARGVRQRTQIVRLAQELAAQLIVDVTGAPAARYTHLVDRVGAVGGPPVSCRSRGSAPGDPVHAR